ncbi:MAG: arylsulfatase A-like enzyme [Planctomycetota bacterium]|jgi:arylsulfatase A-like enzyme
MHSYWSRSRVSLLFVGLLCASCSPKLVPAKYAGERPDVVIVLVDTLRADFVELESELATPFLAELAKESVVFEDASSAAPWTLPSVASLVTGRHIVEHGVNIENRRLPKSMKTLAERLGNLDYETRALYRNAFAGPMCELDRGYEFSKRTEIDIDGEQVMPLLMLPDGSPDKDPLLLYVHNAEPHDPHNTPANNNWSLDSDEREFIDWYREKVDRYRVLTRAGYQDDPRNAGTDFDGEQAGLLAELNERQAEAYRIYARSVKECDERIASIVQKLRERGRWDQTLFIVLSDHGEEMGEHGGWLHDQSLYQELIHVPMIVRFPEGLHGGTRVTEPSSLIDLLPTIMGVIDETDQLADLTGLDWGARLSNDQASPTEPRIVSVRINERKRFGPWLKSRGDQNVVVRDGKWKGIFNIELDSLELFDLEADPDEANDVSSEHSERVAKLKQVAREGWKDMTSRRQVVEGDGFDSLDAGALKNLEDLGYIGD